MATTENYLTITMGYDSSDQERNYKFGGISDAELNNIQARIKAYNANVPAQDKLIFLSDEGDQMTSIVAAKIETITETYIIQED